jgi:hypothetical protein
LHKNDGKCSKNNCFWNVVVIVKTNTSVSTSNTNYIATLTIVFFPKTIVDDLEQVAFGITALPLQVIEWGSRHLIL